MSNSGGPSAFAPSLYTCRECGAQFPSLQALGGHKSAHNVSRKRRAHPTRSSSPYAKRTRETLPPPLGSQAISDVLFKLSPDSLLKTCSKWKEDSEAILAQNWILHAEVASVQWPAIVTASRQLCSPVSTTVMNSAQLHASAFLRLHSDFASLMLPLPAVPVGGHLLSSSRRLKERSLLESAQASAAMGKFLPFFPSHISSLSNPHSRTDAIKAQPQVPAAAFNELPRSTDGSLAKLGQSQSSFSQVRSPIVFSLPQQSVGTPTQGAAAASCLCQQPESKLDKESISRNAPQFTPVTAKSLSHGEKHLSQERHALPKTKEKPEASCESSSTVCGLEQSEPSTREWRSTWRLTKGGAHSFPFLTAQLNETKPSYGLSNRREEQEQSSVLECQNPGRTILPVCAGSESKKLLPECGTEHGFDLTLRLGL